MGKIKAIVIVRLRQQVFPSQAKDVEAKYLEALAPDERAFYQSALPSTRIPLAQAMVMICKAAEILYPGRGDAALRELGRMQAHADMTGLYKVLMRVVTVAYAVKQAAALWRQYHDQGEARVEQDPAVPGAAAFVVTGYPEAPRSFTFYNAGYIAGVLELTGATNVDVSVNFDNPQAWRTEVRWR